MTSEVIATGSGDAIFGASEAGGAGERSFAGTFQINAVPVSDLKDRQAQRCLNLGTCFAVG